MKITIITFGKYQPIFLSTQRFNKGKLSGLRRHLRVNFNNNIEVPSVHKNP